MYTKKVQPGFSGEQMIENGYIYLTHPEGVDWANNGAVARNAQPTQSFSFDFNIQFKFQFELSIKTLQNEIATLDLEETVRSQVDTALENVRQNPSESTLRKLISLAADITTIGTPIFPMVMKWAANSGDLINLFLNSPVGPIMF